MSLEELKCRVTNKLLRYFVTGTICGVAGHVVESNGNSARGGGDYIASISLMMILLALSDPTLSAELVELQRLRVLKARQDLHQENILPLPIALVGIVAEYFFDENTH
jgi:hypothetical protein